MQGGSEEGWSFAYTATAAFDGLHANLQRMEQTLAGLGNRVFLMNNVHHVLTA